jgi:hypothetical protein
VNKTINLLIAVTSENSLVNWQSISRKIAVLVISYIRQPFLVLNAKALSNLQYTPLTISALQLCMTLDKDKF